MMPKIGELLKLLPFERYQNPPPVVGVIRLAGIIAAGGGPMRRGVLALHNLASTIERAFKLPNLKAVALVVNSPGGSPVQSALICQRIRDLAEEKEIPVVAFAEDVAASGGYWLACSGDEIYVNESSIIGSIGVISAGFGLQDLIARYGIERRVHTAGTNKSMLDPFVAEKKEDVERLLTVQEAIHDAFKDLVRERRAGKLKAPEDELFTGEFWTGKQALTLGLVDGIGDVRGIMRARYGEKVKLVLVGARRGWVQRRFGLGPSGEGWLETAVSAVEAKLMWSRYGL
ncbi:MAG: S49 family peptidase [Alphaproteobacteria bacterium]